MEKAQASSVNEKQRRRVIANAVAGGIIIAVILLVTTIWVSNSSRTGTDQAVSKVSEFYLEELAGRRAQVVAEELRMRFSYMENAVAIVEDEDLESQETLRKFFGKVEKLCGLNKFALVDENGIVYKQYTTEPGYDQYSFLSGELTEPAIITMNLDRAKKEVILAIPVEGVEFQGSRIDVCFIQVDIEEMLSALTPQTNYNETFWSM